MDTSHDYDYSAFSGRNHCRPHVLAPAGWRYGPIPVSRYTPPAAFAEPGTGPE